MIIIAFLGVIALIAALLLYSAFSWGLVCYKFYYWFILSVFPGLPLISFWQAVGLVFFISLFKTQSESFKSELKDNKATMTTFIMYPWTLLLVAYLIKMLFM